MFVLAAAIALSSLQLVNVKSEAVTYRGREAVKLIESAPGKDVETVAILKDSSFTNGVIEAELAGLPGPGASDGARGFVGIAFRVNGDGTRYECFYLRPTNGRADDQLRRNHATQYVSHPDHPWYRLRKENPGVYESYADLVPGEWTKIRIEVDGAKARLYVNGSPQPVLIVNDLKHGAGAAGAIALWIGPGTEAYFGKLTVR